MRGNEQNVDDSMVIPADTVQLNPSIRLSLIQKIDLLDTSVIDQLLSLHHRKECYIFPPFSTTEGHLSPFYWKYIGKKELGDDLEMVVLPICDNAHFNGYIVDIKRKTIMFIDSLYPRIKAGKTSIIQKLCIFLVLMKIVLRTLHFFAPFDGSSCGAWLVVGIVANLLEINSFLLTREKVFNAMMILVEDISMPEIHERVKNAFLRESPKIDDDQADDWTTVTEKTQKNGKKRVVFMDACSIDSMESSNDEDDMYDNFIQELKESRQHASTPKKKKISSSISSPEMSDLDLDCSNDIGLAPIQPLSPLNSEGDLSIPSWNVEKPLEDPTDDFQHDLSWHENDQHPSEFPSTVEASINHQHESAFEKRQEFLSTTEIISRIQNEGNVLPSIPPVLTENTTFIIDNSDNVKRMSDGKKCFFR